MQPVDQLVGRELTWAQPSALRNEYRLTADREAVGGLRWEKAFGSLASGEVAGGRWTFKRVGFLHPRVTVRIAGSEVDVATMEPSWTGSGPVQFSDGRGYRWTKTSFWRSEWTMAAQDGRILIQFLPRASLRMRAMVVVDPSARSICELPVLLLLGWYLLVLMSQDAAVAVAASGY